MKWVFHDATKDTEEVVAEGILSESPEDVYEYHRQCFPADSCLEFSLSVPETLLLYDDENPDLTSSYFERSAYRVVFDGRVYSGGDNELYFFGGFDSDDTEDNVYEEPHLYIGECQRSDICNEDESLFEVDFHATRVDLALGGDNTDGTWVLVDTSEEDLEPFEIFGAGRKFDQDYRYYRCISLKGTCMQFSADTIDKSIHGHRTNYTVKLDGKEKAKRRPCKKNEKWCDGYTNIKLGGDSCDLSGGAIGGIVAAVVAAFVIVCIVRRRRGEVDGEDNKSATKEGDSPKEEAPENAIIPEDQNSASATEA